MVKGGQKGGEGKTEKEKRCGQKDWVGKGKGYPQVGRVEEVS